MSYTIMYRSMFVKLSDGRFIPMVEMGDNNVRDWNGRRSRLWQQWVIGKSFKTFPAYTKDEIMAEVECVINNEKKRVGQPYADYGVIIPALPSVAAIAILPRRSSSATSS